MNKFVAFVATPWFPVFDDMAKVGDCSHHLAITINGKNIDGGQYEYKFTNERSLVETIAFDIDGTKEEFKLDALGQNNYGGTTKTKVRTTSSVKFAFSGNYNGSYTNTTLGEVVFPNMP
jgi:hypothetical protein